MTESAGLDETLPQKPLEQHELLSHEILSDERIKNEPSSSEPQYDSKTQSVGEPPSNFNSQLASHSILRRLKPFRAMMLFLLLGLLVAICQHQFYASLDGRQLQEYFIEQIWVIRIGTALAFLFKASLVASLGIAFCQSSWFYFQQEPITVDGIDAIFGVLRDPTRFFMKEMLLNTRVLSLMALISWCLPLSAIFAPASLIGYPQTS
jgi:hypothetical protein